MRYTKPSNLISTTLTEVKNLPKVKSYLDSVEENSWHTKNVYLTGLAQFQDFLNLSYENGYNLNTILVPLSRKKNQMDVYDLLNKFMLFLRHKHENYKQQSANTIIKELSRNSIRLYVSGARAYLSYYNIAIDNKKFIRKVKIPKIYREDEIALEASDIRKILLSCSNKRLKTYLLCLASGGMRASEAIMIRIKDINNSTDGNIDWSASPTEIHLRKEYTKTHVARDIYISDEATRYLKDWITFKYRDRIKESGNKLLVNRTMNPEDLVFSVYDTAGIKNNVNTKFNPFGLYIRISRDFDKVLETVGLAERKEGMQRRKITLHSFRRFVKTVLSKEVGFDYSEWFLGHIKSPYWVTTKQDKEETYKTKCMKYLTFLDYEPLEARDQGIENQLAASQDEIDILRKRDITREQELKSMQKRLDRMVIIMENMNVDTIEQFYPPKTEERKVQFEKRKNEARERLKDLSS